MLSWMKQGTKGRREIIRGRWVCCLGAVVKELCEEFSLRGGVWRQKQMAMG